MPTLQNAALLVIDVQKSLFEKTIPIYRADELLQNVNALVARAHAAGVPVVYVQHGNKGDLAPGTDGWQLHAGLQPTAADLMARKEHGNAFEKTPLHETLQARNVKTVVTTGLVTHGCVKATSLGAKELGYRVVLATDAHSNYHKQAAQVIADTNKLLGEAGVELCPAADITFGA